MIPKTIHYCWFGRNPKPDLALKCIKSWKKYCPDYKIIEWNEDNFDISACPLYVRQAYEHKKWPFVTDYVRLKVVYDHGGIYLDTDVELKKRLDPFLNNPAYFGFEDSKYVATGLGFGAEQGANILQVLMDDYQEISFLMDNGEMDMTACPVRNTEVFLRRGLKQDGKKQVLPDGTLILAVDYLCPFDNLSGIMRRTKNTVSIHHFNASWVDEETKNDVRKTRKIRRAWQRKDYILHIPNRIVMMLVGKDRYERIKSFLKCNRC